MQNVIIERFWDSRCFDANEAASRPFRLHGKCECVGRLNQNGFRKEGKTSWSRRRLHEAPVSSHLGLPRLGLFIRGLPFTIQDFVFVSAQESISRRDLSFSESHEAAVSLGMRDKASRAARRRRSAAEVMNSESIETRYRKHLLLPSS